MKTIIDDDVLFTNKPISELRFEIDLGKEKIFVKEKSKAVGSLNFHYDKELEESYDDENLGHCFDDVHYVYINNEVVTLNKMKLWKP